MAAHNGLGDVEMYDAGNAKKALLSYLRVVVYLGPNSGMLSPEHETGIASAAIAAARYAIEKKDILETKKTYIERATGLLAELRNQYSTKSSWIEPVKAEIEKAKQAK